ncbi:MAG: hypothetical protein ISN29_07440 [Gammaproteobacteria bacterium AqS3]|nr:hypothetical protein [Gammaproteobacteria bacterium AqS3]
MTSCPYCSPVNPRSDCPFTKFHIVAHTDGKPDRIVDVVFDKIEDAESLARRFEIKMPTVRFTVIDGGERLARLSAMGSAMPGKCRA